MRLKVRFDDFWWQLSVWMNGEPKGVRYCYLWTEAISEAFRYARCEFKDAAEMESFCIILAKGK